MNKKELVNSVADMQEITKNESGEILDAMLDTIMETVAVGETVIIAGFGKFMPKVRAARKGRNPATGESIDIAEKTVVTFKPQKAFADLVNGE
jgi:DNA-binding protein HU-beta